GFYISIADFERSAKTAQLIQKAYKHADRRYRIIEKTIGRQDMLPESILVVESYVGIRNISELTLSEANQNSILLTYRLDDGSEGRRVLRSPKAVGAAVLGIPMDEFENELELAAE